VIGTFNDWDGATDPMNPEKRGYWYVAVEGARVGDQYKHQLMTKAGDSVGNAIVHDLGFDWRVYSETFEGHPTSEAEAVPGDCDGLPFHARVSIAPFSVLIYSQ
jgi:hypothetical protein